MKKIIIFCIALFGFTPFAFADISTTTNVAFYKFNEVSGELIDYSGNSNNGGVNGISYTSGIINGAYLFNGTSDYVNLSNSSSFSFSNAITISAWVYITSTSSNGIIIGNDTNTARCWDLGINDNQIQYQFFTPDAHYGNIGTIPLNQWTFIAETFDGDTHMINVYENGVNILNLGSVGSSMNVSGNDIMIGRRAYSGSELYLNAKIDELGVWNVALSGSDISALYNSGLGLSYPFTITSTSTATTTSSITDYSLDFGIAILIVLMFIITIGFIFNNLHIKK